MKDHKPNGFLSFLKRKDFLFIAFLVLCLLYLYYNKSDDLFDSKNKDKDKDKDEEKPKQQPQLTPATEEEDAKEKQLEICLQENQVLTENLRQLRQQREIEDSKQIGGWEVLTRSPRAFYHRTFLTDYECDYIINLGKDLLTRSLVAGNHQSDARTSYGTFLTQFHDDPVIQGIIQRLTEQTLLPIDTNGEDFYLLRYEVGQQYKPHWDYFVPTHYDEETREKLLGRYGQRMATAILYLNTPEEGGETVFPSANITLPAQKRAALLFRNTHFNATLDPMSLHGGNPVIKGQKWIVTKWIREQAWI